MIVGSARGGVGSLATFKSTDLLNWSITSTLKQATDEDLEGRYWEMPYFIKLNDQNEYLLGVGPLFSNKPAQSIYWIGKWENERFTPYHKEPQYLEFARDQMLAPSFGYDEEGRVTYIGIVPETRTEESQIASGWRQTFSLPRVVRMMNDSTLGTYAHPNLCRYRENEITINDRIIEPGTSGNLTEFSGNQIELQFKFLAEDSAKFSVKFLQSEDGSQFTSIDFDLEENTILADRRNASSEQSGASARLGRYVFDYQDTIYLQVYIDHSIVEAFIDNTLAYSGRVYPSESSQLVDVEAQEKSLRIIEASQWNMKSIGSPAGNEVCEPSFVPEDLRDPPVIEEPDEPLGLSDGDKIEIFPNPSNGIISLKGLPAQPVNLDLINAAGQILWKEKVRLHDSLDFRNYESGLYFLKIFNENFLETRKLILTNE
jgi:sucrose-6-phosphate hydrolase SacC (GH32 family)